MLLLFQALIEQRDLTQHPDRLYLFGDNEARTGRGGQAGACRGFANAVGVATKRVPERTASAYWTDADYDRVIAIIDRDLASVFDHVRQGGTVVCPASGLGTGLAELPSRAPRVFAYLRERITLLKQLGQATPGPSLPARPQQEDRLHPSHGLLLRTPRTTRKSLHHRSRWNPRRSLRQVRRMAANTAQTHGAGRNPRRPRSRLLV